MHAVAAMLSHRNTHESTMNLFHPSTYLGMTPKEVRDYNLAGLIVAAAAMDEAPSAVRRIAAFEALHLAHAQTQGIGACWLVIRPSHKALRMPGRGASFPLMVMESMRG